MAKLLPKAHWGRVFIFSVTVLLFFYIFSLGIRNIFRYNAFKLERTELVSRRNSLLQQQRVLVRQLYETGSPDFWEFQAKLNLGYVNSGEHVYVFLPSNL